jgi:LysR family hydrogen peroxide-inducible transcriptional activator
MQLFDEQLYACTAADDPLSEGAGPVDLSELKGKEFLSL